MMVADPQQRRQIKHETSLDWMVQRDREQVKSIISELSHRVTENIDFSVPECVCVCGDFAHCIQITISEI